MFENSDVEKPRTQEQHLFPPFRILDTNTPLKGHIKQLGKYQFSFDQKLGSGLTSDAYIGVEKQSHKLVCVKIIDRQTFKNQTQRAMLTNEIKCQQQLQSPYIVNIFDVYDTNSFCFVVTELCQDGDLFKLIQFSRVGLPEELVTRLGLNLAQALLKMKQCKIVHRDIKSENVMLKNGVAKLGDFGFAIEEKDLKQKEQFSIGSPLYMPLQSLQQNKYSYDSDLFSFGVVLYQMLHAQSPWECNEEKELIQKIKNQKITFKTSVSPKFQKIISSCLQIIPENRAKIQKVVQQLRLLVDENKNKEAQNQEENIPV